MTKPIAAVVLLFVALSSAVCHKSSGPPTAPSSAPPGTATSIVIQGPTRIGPGETVQFTAIATFGDRTTRNYTKDVKWGVSPKGVLTISETGEAIALARGEAHVFATLPSTGCGASCSPQTVVLVVPPNTYRLTGKVLESGLPVQGARVSVNGGSDSTLSATTEYDGQYRFYGVAGRVQIKVAKSGYEEMAKAITVTADDVLDFPEARQIAAIPLVSGTYVLTLQADNDCSTAPSAYNTPPLPPEARQRRTYSAQVEQDGPLLAVSLPPAQFAAPSNQFSGRIHPGTVEFQFGDGYLYYGPDNAITERLATQAISFQGFVRAERSGSALLGPLDGVIQVFGLSDSGSGRFNKLTGQCRAPNHRFTMTPSAGRLR